MKKLILIFILFSNIMNAQRYVCLLTAGQHSFDPCIPSCIDDNGKTKAKIDFSLLISPDLLNHNFYLDISAGSLTNTPLEIGSGLSSQPLDCNLITHTLPECEDVEVEFCQFDYQTEILLPSIPCPSANISVEFCLSFNKVLNQYHFPNEPISSLEATLDDCLLGNSIFQNGELCTSLDYQICCAEDYCLEGRESEQISSLVIPHIYPNPFNSNLFIKNLDNFDRIVILSSLGKPLFDMNLHDKSSLEINLKDINSGPLNVTFYKEGRIGAIQKLIKI